jgi:hypothetical protein
LKVWGAGRKAEACCVDALIKCHLEISAWTIRPNTTQPVVMPPSANALLATACSAVSEEHARRPHIGEFIISLKKEAE